MNTHAAPASAPLLRGRTSGRAPVKGSTRAPGVSVEWMGPVFRELGALRSDVVGLVGLAPRGPTDRATRLESVSDYEGVYGPVVDGMLLGPAVHGFFANGGTTCWVVRTLDRDAARAAEASVPHDGSAPPELRITARTEGTWANGMAVDLVPVGDGLLTLTITAPDGRREFWRDLDVEMVTQVFGTDDTGRTSSALVRFELSEVVVLPRTPARVRLDGGEDGLATLSPSDFTGEDSVGGPHPRGAALLGDIDEISQVAVPDLVLRDRENPLDAASHGPTAVADAQAYLVGECTVLGRTALLHHPDPGARADQVVAWRQQFDSAFATLHWPWLRIPDPAHPDRLLTCVPDGHVAGVVARCDRAVGPHKPPANESLTGALGLTCPVDDGSHGLANDAGVDVIRAVPGRGIRVMGARTLSNDPQWRYLNVRRLVTQVERSVAAYAGWLVFEPDDGSLREDLARVVRRHLDDLWRAGALDGTSAVDAFSVHVDTGSASRIDGELVVEIGLRLPSPAEYVVVRIDLTDVSLRDISGGESRGDDRQSR